MDAATGGGEGDGGGRSKRTVRDFGSRAASVACDKEDFVVGAER